MCMYVYVKSFLFFLFNHFGQSQQRVCPKLWLNRVYMQVMLQLRYSICSVQAMEEKLNFLTSILIKCKGNIQYRAEFSGLQVVLPYIVYYLQQKISLVFQQRLQKSIIKFPKILVFERPQNSCHFDDLWLTMKTSQGN